MRSPIHQTLWSRLGRTVLLASLGAFLVVACGEAPRKIPLLPDAPRSGIHKSGPLAVLGGNPRYFTDTEGRRAIYLTGSHTWNNFQDWGRTDPPHPFDYTAYLDFLERHGHNFIRLYVWEQAAWFPGTEEKIVITPLPYLRTGPGHALDGGPRFDLTRFDPVYFDRLHERVEVARKRGIYVSVMLFNGWSIELKGKKSGNPWRGHPFNRDNNVDGIDGDTDRDGEGKEVHTLLNPAVTSLQKTYLRKIVDTLGDLDNILWEISNESHPGAVEWQYEMIRTIRELESTAGKRHPVGMTSMWPHGKEGNASLFESPADWISAHSSSSDPYGDEPPASTGRKIIVSDTDHIWGIGGDARWVWMSFLRGLNPIFMDPYEMVMRDNYPLWPSSESDRGASASSPASEWQEVRKAMGYARALADRVELASMQPMGELASTGLLPGRSRERVPGLPRLSEWQVEAPYRFAFEGPCRGARRGGSVSSSGAARGGVGGCRAGTNSSGFSGEGWWADRVPGALRGRCCASCKGANGPRPRAAGGTIISV